MRSAWEGWSRFWFQPTSTATLGVFRIAVGLVTLGWAMSLAPDLRPFFSETGVLPAQPELDHWWGLLDVFPSDAAVTALYALLVVGAVCLTVGYRTRLAAVVVWLAMLSFERRNPWIVNSGDLLLRHLVLFLMLAPSGAALSLDRWRRARPRFWDFPKRAPWVLRLVQIQLSMMYVAAVWEKVRGTTWNDGTAVSYVLRLDDLTRFAVPAELSGSLLLSNVLTYGTLAIELSLGLLVWNRRLRPWVLGFGVALHLAIAATTLIGFFTLAVLAAYVVWVPEATMERWVVSARDAVRRRTVARGPAAHEPALGADGPMGGGVGAPSR